MPFLTDRRVDNIKRNLVVLLLTCTAFSVANAQVVVKNIEIVDERYSSKTLKIELEYDGSFGDALTLGLLPVTSRQSYRSNYVSYLVRKGNSELTMPIYRPETYDNSAIESWGINFFFTYSNREDQFVLVEEYDLIWRGIKDYFNVSSLPAELLSSMTKVSINEALENSYELIAWLAQRSPKIDDIDISFMELPPDPSLSPILALRVAEDVSFEDLQLLSKKMVELSVPINTVMFENLSDRNNLRGSVSIGPIGNSIMPEDATNPIEVIANAQSLESVHDYFRFTPTPQKEYSALVLNQIITLNDQTSHNSSRQAKELATYLLAKDPDVPRAYVELARSEIYATHGDEGLIAAKNIIQLALNIFPEDSYVNHYAGFLEYRYEEYEKAILYFRLADQQKQQENIWLINNWANTLMVLGNTAESLEKYSSLLKIKATTPTDQRALFYGLTDYAEELVNQRSNAVGPIYEKLIAEFPDRAKCSPVDYAQYKLFTTGDAEESLKTLGRAEQYQCDDYNAVAALIDIYTWHNKKGSRAELYRSFLKHAQIEELIYRIANSNDPVPLLAAMGKNGVNLDQVDRYGISALFKAIEESNSYAVSTLASAGADVNGIQEEGLSPLILAVFNEDAEIVRALLDAGADPQLKNEFGYSAQMMAEQMGNLELLSILKTNTSSGV